MAFLSEIIDNLVILNRRKKNRINRPFIRS